jgi:RNA polymerase sigma factor (TIGR02999 family)
VNYNLAMNDVTRILSAIEQGDSNAAEELLPLVYQELRKLAAAKLSKEKTGHSLQPTVLVHEAYLRLVDVDQPQQWNGRGHFFAAAAEAMRRILVDFARRKNSEKHGGQLRRVSLDDDLAATRDREVDLLALDEALARLEQRWPDKANLVKLRYFAGLTIPEASRAIGVSRATGERYWTFAKAWLHLQLSNGEEQSGKI